MQGAFYEVYKKFRNTQKEEVCHNALIRELQDKGLQAIKNKRINIFYKDEKVGVYVPDIIINGLIIIEIKCKAFLTKEDIKQFWYYLKCSDFQLGYLVNFGKPNGVEIIRRINIKKV